MLNTCQLEGKLSGSPESRTFPSGDEVVLFRLVVPREDGGRVDTIDCRVELSRLRKRVLALPAGATLQVEGALHRRFWRTASGPASRYEVQVHTMHRVSPPSP